MGSIKYIIQTRNIAISILTYYGMPYGEIHQGIALYNSYSITDEGI